MTDLTFCRWEWEGASTKQMIAFKNLAKQKKKSTVHNSLHGHTNIQHMHTKTDQQTPDKHLITQVSIGVCETSWLVELVD